MQITVTQDNQAPVANAGPDQTKSVPVGDQVNVTLNGTGSTDPDGTITNYYWSWLVNGQSRNATGATPMIALPEGQFTVQLVVHDGQIYSQADTVVITITQGNQAPVANAGPDQTKALTTGFQTTVNLNGTGSYDPDGTITNYYWSWVVGGQSRNAIAEELHISAKTVETHRASMKYKLNARSAAELVEHATRWVKARK